jgi:putative transposase
MKGLPRGTFDQLVKKHNADKYSKHFGHWDQLIAMLYAQLSGTTGMRPLVKGFNSHVSHHYHLGVAPLKRNTLADANKNRADTVFSETAAWLMTQVSRKERNESKELMFLLDSTSVTLKGREFEHWTADNRTRNTQGIKLHVLMESQSKTPAWSSFSAANVNDVDLARAVPLEPGALYVFDKGYCDYNWWHSIDTAGARFVTRFKKNAGLKTVEERVIPEVERNVILGDRLVTFRSKNPGGKRNHYDKPLRCITVERSDKPTPLVLATNDLTASASAIAQSYKDRWAIELFFKWIKQHLKIKKFLGRTENAVRIQILTALISYLLIALHKQRNALTDTLWECLYLVRATLFQRLATETSRYKRRRDEDAILARIQPRLF